MGPLFKSGSVDKKTWRVRWFRWSSVGSNPMPPNPHGKEPAILYPFGGIGIRGSFKPCILWVRVPQGVPYALIAQWTERLATDQMVGGSNPSKGTRLCGRNSIGRVPAFQAECCGFESHRPLNAEIAQPVEHDFRSIRDENSHWKNQEKDK